MHSIRRAALRAASSSAPLATGVSRQQLLSLAMRQSKVTARPAFALPNLRSFSQSFRVAQDGEKQAVEEAVKAYEEEMTTSEAVDAVPEPDNTSTLPETQRSPVEEEPGHAVYVANMTFEVTDEHLRDAFGKYGEITKVLIGRDTRGLSRGFGFVTFADKEAAKRVVDEANNSFWHGRRIVVAHRHAKGEKPRRENRRPREESAASVPSASLFIGNIPYESSDADLNRMFRELDNVTDVRVAVDRNTGWPRGFAHADFVDVESARNALNKLRETPLKGRTLRVDFARTPTRDRVHRNKRENRSGSEDF